MNQVQRIAFFAICKYFDHDDTVADDEDSMKRWMRVVWNLISGQGEDGRAQIRSTMAIRTAIEHIEMLDPHDVYNSLSNMTLDERTSDFQIDGMRKSIKLDKLFPEMYVMMEETGKMSL